MGEKSTAFIDIVGQPAFLAKSGYNLILGSESTEGVKMLINGTTRGSWSASGLAVTGAITATTTLTASGGLVTKQAVTNVNDTTPSAAELATALGAAATLGRGFIGTIDDNDGDTNGFIVWCSDASFYFVKGTKAT